MKDSIIWRKVVAGFVVALMITTSLFYFFNPIDHPMASNEKTIDSNPEAEIDIFPMNKSRWDFNIVERNGEYMANTGDFKVVFSEDLVNDGITIIKGNRTISIVGVMFKAGLEEWQFKEIVRVDKNVIEYRTQCSQVTLQYQIGPTQLKEYIIVHEPIRDANIKDIRISSEFQLSDGLRLLSSDKEEFDTNRFDDGPLFIVDENSARVFTLPAPNVIDRDGKIIESGDIAKRYSNEMRTTSGSTFINEFGYVVYTDQIPGEFPIDLVMPTILFHLKSSEYPIEIDPTITGTETWENQIIDITSDLILEPTATLNLIDVTLIMHSTSSTKLKIWVKSGATLDLKTTYITAHDHAYGYSFNEDGTLNTNMADITYADPGIAFGATAVADCGALYVHDTFGTGISMSSGATIELKTVDVYQCGGDGVSISSSNFDINALNVHDCLGKGILVTGVTDGALEWTRAYKNSGEGFSFMGSSGISLVGLIAEENSVNFKFNGCTLTLEDSGSSQSVGNGIQAISSPITLIDSYCEKSGNKDLMIDGNLLTTKDTIFNKESVQFANGGSLNVKWGFDLGLFDPDFTYADNILVTIRDSSSAIVFQDYTDAEGAIPTQYLLEYSQDTGGRVLGAPYTVSFLTKTIGLSAYGRASYYLCTGDDSDLDGIKDVDEKTDDVLWFEAEDHVFDYCQIIETANAINERAAECQATSMKFFREETFRPIATGTYVFLFNAKSQEESSELSVTIKDGSSDLFTQSFVLGTNYRWYITKEFTVTDGDTVPVIEDIGADLAVIDRFAFLKVKDGAGNRLHHPHRISDYLLIDTNRGSYKDGDSFKSSDFLVEAEYVGYGESYWTKDGNAANSYAIKRGTGFDIVDPNSFADISLSTGTYECWVRAKRTDLAALPLVYEVRYNTVLVANGQFTLTDNFEWFVSTKFTVQTAGQLLQLNLKDNSGLPSILVDQVYFIRRITSANVQWTQAAGALVTSAAAINPNGDLFFGSGTNMKSWTSGGVLRWTTPISGSPSSSVIFGERVYTGALNNMYGFLMTTGISWSYLRVGTASMPSIGEGLLVTGFVSGGSMTVVGLNPESGAQIWVSAAYAGGAHYPIIVGDYVVIHTSNALKVLSAADGSLVRSISIPNTISTRLCISQTLIIFGTTAGVLYAYDLAGNLAWSLALGSSISKGPIVHNNRVYVGTANQRLYQVSMNDLSTGTYVTIGAGMTQPTIVEDYLAIGTSTYLKLYDISGATPVLMTQVAISGGVTSSSVLGDADKDGYVEAYCFGGTSTLNSVNGMPVTYLGKIGCGMEGVDALGGSNTDFQKSEVRKEIGGYRSFDAQGPWSPSGTLSSDFDGDWLTNEQEQEEYYGYDRVEGEDWTCSYVIGAGNSEQEEHRDSTTIRAFDDSDQSPVLQYKINTLYAGKYKFLIHGSAKIKIPKAEKEIDSEFENDIVKNMAIATVEQISNPNGIGGQPMWVPPGDPTRKMDLENIERSVGFGSSATNNDFTIITREWHLEGTRDLEAGLIAIDIQMDIEYLFAQTFHYQGIDIDLANAEITLANFEIVKLGTDPTKFSTDTDFIADGVEVLQGTYPLNADADEDGLSDPVELLLGTSSVLRDSDDDMVRDRIEAGITTNDPATPWDTTGSRSSQFERNQNPAWDPYASNTDADTEPKFTTDPTLRDTDGDGLPDGWIDGWWYTVEDNMWYQDSSLMDESMDDYEYEDKDLDGKWDGAAFETNPKIPFTDADSLADGWERWNSFNPLSTSDPHGDDGNPDADYFSNKFEYAAYTDPREDDSDEDGIVDGLEGITPQFRTNTKDGAYSYSNYGQIASANQYEWVWCMNTELGFTEIRTDDFEGWTDGVPQSPLYHWDLRNMGLIYFTTLKDDSIVLLKKVSGAYTGFYIWAPNTVMTERFYTDGPFGTVVVFSSLSQGQAPSTTDPDPAYRRQELYALDPTRDDTDLDGFTDNVDFKPSTSYMDDFDGDGLRDGRDIDEDNDYLRGSYEDSDLVFTQTEGDANPYCPDTDGDTIIDSNDFTSKGQKLFADYDNDGLNGYPAHAGGAMFYDGSEEKLYQTDYTNEDSDGDSLWDGDEVDLNIDLDIYDSDYTSKPKSGCTDTDSDGIPDGTEVTAGEIPGGVQMHNCRTDPSNADTDRDGMDDLWELQYYPDTNPNDNTDATEDADNDLLTNLEEHNAGTNPSNGNTDSDYFDDWWEVRFGVGDEWDEDDDPDGDLKTNGEEYDYWAWNGHGTSPPVYKQMDYLSDPFVADTDHGTKNDKLEIESGKKTNDLNDDGFTDTTPEDGMDDSWANTYGVAGYPNGNADADLNKREDPARYTINGATVDYELTNILEFQFGSNPTDRTSDVDDIPDIFEYYICQNTIFKLRGSYDDADYDADTDHDSDGLTTAQEMDTSVWTLPWDPDTDGDGMTDGWEQSYINDGLDPKDNTDADDDGDDDGLTNLEEFQHGTHPGMKDTDGDSYPDGFEIENDDYFNPILYSTMPSIDSDSDGLSDYEENRGNDETTDPDKRLKMGSKYSGPDGGEVFRYGTDYQDEDSDDDYLNDGLEAKVWGIAWTNDIDGDGKGGEVSELADDTKRNNLLDWDSDGDVRPNVAPYVDIYKFRLLSYDNDGNEKWDCIVDFPPCDGIEYSVANLRAWGSPSQRVAKGIPNMANPDVDWEGQDAIGTWYDKAPTPSAEKNIYASHSWAQDLDNDGILNWKDTDIDRDSVPNTEDESVWGLRFVKCVSDKVDWRDGHQLDWKSSDTIGEFAVNFRIGEVDAWLGLDPDNSWEDQKLRAQQEWGLNVPTLSLREDYYWQPNYASTVIGLPLAETDDVHVQIQLWDLDVSWEYNTEGIEASLPYHVGAALITTALELAGVPGMGIVHCIELGIIIGELIEGELDRHDQYAIAQQGDNLDLRYWTDLIYVWIPPGGGDPVEYNMYSEYNCGYWRGDDGEVESNIPLQEDGHPGYSEGPSFDTDGYLFFHFELYDMHFGEYQRSVFNWLRGMGEDVPEHPLVQMPDAGLDNLIYEYYESHSGT